MLNSIVLKPPVVGVASNALLGVRPYDVRSVATLSTIKQHAPVAPGRWICRYNEDYVLQADWHLVQLMPGDRVVFMDMPMDSDVIKGALYIGLAYLSYGASTWVSAAGYGAGWAAAAGIAVNVVGSMVINSLLPIQPRAGAGSAANAATVYSASLSGNVAKLDQPVWKICGRRKITPPFAAQPYFIFKPKPDPDATGDNTDQYYYALFAIGVGDHEYEYGMIGLTGIKHFSDVLVNNYLPPGTAPSVVRANVITSPDVSSIELNTRVYTSAFASCFPTRKVSLIGIDIVAPQGLGDAQNNSKSVAWQVEVRSIDDFGTPNGNWGVLGIENKSASTGTPQRWSFEYATPDAQRYEVRVLRTDDKDTSAGARHSIQWVGLRATLNVAAPLNPNVAHYEIVMRASLQLNQNTQTQFSMILIGKARTLDVSLTWGAYTATRNPAWWILELATNPIWGLNFPDATIDLQSFYDYSLLWDTRQDRCDYAFTESLDGWEAMQLLARTGRARVFRRNGILTIARDEWFSLPVTAFTPRNTVPGSMTLHENLPTRDMPDGVIIEYEDYRTWISTPFEVPCPGFSARDTSSIFYNVALPLMANPVRKKLDAVTGPTHAKREGIYEAWSLALRRTTVSCTTEMQGLLPAFMSPILWQPELVEYGQTGDVVTWDESSNVMTLSEPVSVGADATYLFIIRDDGSITAPVQVYAGPTAYDVVLPGAPDFDMVLDSAQRERPIFVLTTAKEEIVKVSSISDAGKDSSGAQLYTIAATLDDVRVHTADNFLLSLSPQDLPAYGEFVDSTTVAFHDHFVASDALFGPVRAELEMTSGGTAAVIGSSLTTAFNPIPQHNGDTPINFPGEWSNSIIESSLAAKFEVRFTYLGGIGSSPRDPGLTDQVPPNVGVELLDVWSSLGAGRNIGLRYDDAGHTRAITVIRVEIRDKTSHLVQAIGTVTLLANTGLASGGGGPPADGSDGDSGDSGDGEGA